MSPVYSSYQEVMNIIRNGGLVVLPTDTIYGVVASTQLPEAVQALYALRQRPKDKPFIVLIGAMAQLGQFNLELNPAMQQSLRKLWPGPVSVILPCPHPDLEYLHRGTNSLAFRLPDNPELQALLKQTGPLVAPSANLAGNKPAVTIAEAQAYFGSKVDAYVDGGRLDGPPSRLVKIKQDGSISVLRP